MVTTVIKSIGDGKDFANPAAFFTYASGLDLVALNQIVIGEMYDPVTASALGYRTFSVAKASSTCYAVLRPAAGKNWQAMDPTNGDYGTLGMELQIVQNAPFRVGDGCIVENFRIKAMANDNWNVIECTGGTSTFRNCKIFASAIWRGNVFFWNQGTVPVISDNIFYLDGMTGGNIFGINTAGGRFIRNTFISRNTSTFKLAYQDSGTVLSFAGEYVDNIFVGFTTDTMSNIHGNVGARNNYTDAVGYSRVGFTVTTTPVIKSLTDARLADNSPVIGKGSTISFNTTDPVGVKRGYTPDPGAYQRTAGATVRPAYVRQFPHNLDFSDPLLNNLLIAVPFNQATSVNAVKNTTYSSYDGGNATITIVPGDNGYTFINGRGGMGTNGPDYRPILGKPFSLFITTNTAPDSSQKLLYAQVASVEMFFGLNTDYDKQSAPGTLFFRFGDYQIFAPNAVDGTKATYGIICSGPSDNGATFKLVKNGEVLPSQTYGTMPNVDFFKNPNSFTLAGTNEYTHQSVNANMYNFLFFDRVLSDSENAALYSLLTEVPPPPADYVMPQITISASPQTVILSNEALVISANATDDVAVKNVTFKRDGVAFKTDTSMPYTADVFFTRAQNGTYTFTGIVEDTYGNKTESAPISVVVNIPEPDVTAPGIVLTANAPTIKTEVPVVLSANATDDRGVKNVQFFMNDVLIDTVSAAPYTTSKVFTYKENAIYRFKAIVTDTSNNKTTSNEVLVNVDIVLPPAGTYTIGTGRDFATLSAFVGFVNGLDMVKVGTPVVGLVYGNVASESMQIMPANANESYFVTIKPALGLSVNDKEGNIAYDYGTLGLEWTVNGSYLKIGDGVCIEGFRMNIPDGAGNSYGCIASSGRTSGYTPTFRNCRFKFKASNPSFNLGEYAIGTRFQNCLIIQETNWPVMFAVGSLVIIDGCTLVRRNHNGTGTIGVLFSTPNMFAITSTIIVGNTTEPGGSTQGWRTSRWNVTDSESAWATTSKTGFTFAATKNAMIQNGTNDYRPAGIALGTGGQGLVSINDIRGKNRGLVPDSGSIQLVPATPLAIGTLTGDAPTPDGQSMKYVGTVSDSPTSATITFNPGSGTLGARNIGPLPVTLNNGAFTFELDDMPPGNYRAAQFTFINAGGRSSMLLGLPFEINGVTSSAVDESVVLSITGSPQLPQ
jgi:hypothetical protein